MLFETYNLLPLTADVSAEPDTYSYSAKNKGAGFSMKSSSLHTAVITFVNFTGSIKLQGTLMLYPGESDWVDIILLEYRNSTIAPDSVSENFTGNWVWLRSAHILDQGEINVRYNF